MHDRLITIASFATPLEARMAMNQLEAAGIRAALEGEATTGMAWHLTNAIGGVKLLVLERDSERAIAILDGADDEHDSATEGLGEDADFNEPDDEDWDEDTDEDHDDEEHDDEEHDDEDHDDEEHDDEEVEDAASDGANEAEDDEAEEKLTRREEDADRAFRGTVVGILFFPIQFYALWLLVKVFASEERLRAEKRKRAIAAAALCIPCVILWCMVLRMMGSW
jgi:hypothetical protein